MIFTYLLKSDSDKSYYCGISNNPERRLVEHNSGKLKITSLRRPWRLVYFSGHDSYECARKHEKWLKKKNRIYKDKLAQLAPLHPANIGRGKYAG